MVPEQIFFFLIVYLFMRLHQVLVFTREIFVGVGRLSNCGLGGLVAPLHVGSQFSNLGSNPLLLHWKADSCPPGKSPRANILYGKF